MADRPSLEPSMDRTTPRRFGYDEPARALLIEWMDGGGQAIPFDRLRRACPCALCTGELGRPGRFQLDPELHQGEDELADIQLVGNYGLKVIWNDGHDTGIYRFEILRQIGDGEKR
ncbi:MAG: gamma-butyrobetaine hydroxylase-like domain-containing protein [Candidatus Dormibacteria bacterium]